MDYSDPTTATSADDPSESPDTDKGSEDQEDETEGLLSKAFFKGKDLKVGGTCEIVIDQILDDEVICHYNKGHESKDEGSTMDRAKANLDKYTTTPEEA